MNAYLPSLARASKEVVQASNELNEVSQHAQPSNDTDDSDEALLLDSSRTERVVAKQNYSKALTNATSQISSKGIALGYLAGIILLIVALIPVTKLKGSTFSLRLAIGLSGVWWAVFSLPAAAWLPAGTADSSTEVVPGQKWKLSGQILAAWKRLGGMLRWTEIKKLQHTFRYLAAWFLLSDGQLSGSSGLFLYLNQSSGFTTMTSTAILFAKTTLFMPPSSLILIGVMTPSAGILGSLAWPYFQRRFAYSNLKMLVILVALASLIPLYGCLGFLPVLQNASWGGLTHPAEMYVVVVYFGKQ